MKRLIIIAIPLLAAGAGLLAWQRSRPAAGRVFHTTAEAARGSVRSVIRATGTIEPENLIDIGAQVAGQILSFGTDMDGNPVDYCSRVAEGMVLARLDDATYQADLRVALAQLASATASVARARAGILQAAARGDQAAGEWARAQTLGVGAALSQAAHDNYRFAAAIADANLEASRAELLQARAAVVQAEAAVEKAGRNLGYCTILSPVDGVVVDRRVNVGQTVVASLSAPSLFLVAKDLSRVEIWVAVNEADIGGIKPGMPVAFTVDALPGAAFEGRVNKIRLNAAMAQNVVTYTVEVKTDNPGGVLLPYLTANIQFITGEARDALLVPASALRWQPAGLATSPGGGCVHVLDPVTREPRRVEVVAGVSDGFNTEVSSPELREGDLVITGAATGEKRAAPAPGAGGSNPFMPKMPTPPRRVMIR